MRKITYIISISLLLITCKSNTMYDAPKDLIPKDTMQMLLKDIYIALSTKNYSNINGESGRDYINLVYNKYNIDSTRFSSSNIYYTSKITAYEIMLKEVKRQLDSMHKQLRTLDSIKRKNDSTSHKSKIERLKK